MSILDTTMQKLQKDNANEIVAIVDVNDGDYEVVVTPIKPWSGDHQRETTQIQAAMVLKTLFGYEHALDDRYSDDVNSLFANASEEQYDYMADNGSDLSHQDVVDLLREIMTECVMYPNGHTLEDVYAIIDGVKYTIPTISHAEISDILETWNTIYTAE